MATTIVTLTQGSYSYENGTIKANGGLNINPSKVITRMDGPVRENDVQIGSFVANRDTPESQGNLQFQITFTDPSKAALLLQFVQEAVTAVQAKLNE